MFEDAAHGLDLITIRVLDAVLFARLAAVGVDFLLEFLPVAGLGGL